MQAAMRDASWFAKPGRARVYHIASYCGTMECNIRRPLHMEEAVDAAAVPVIQRCRRGACRTRWPQKKE